MVGTVKMEWDQSPCLNSTLTGNYEYTLSSRDAHTSSLDQDLPKPYSGGYQEYVYTELTPVCNQGHGAEYDYESYFEPKVSTYDSYQTVQLPLAIMDTSCPGGPSTPRRTEAKYCGVCGDKALGYNFNAVTCESCKAFFRRNALKNKELRCPFNDNCKVDVVTRRFCQKCRLKKCFDIGMKKEWIMTEEEKRMKRAKIDENRSKRHHEMTTKVNNEASRAATPLIVLNSSDHVKPQARVMGMPQVQPEKDISETVVEPKTPKGQGQMDVHSAASSPGQCFSPQSPQKDMLSPHSPLTTVMSPASSLSSSSVPVIAVSPKTLLSSRDAKEHIVSPRSVLSVNESSISAESSASESHIHLVQDSGNKTSVGEIHRVITGASASGTETSRKTHLQSTDVPATVVTTVISPNTSAPNSPSEQVLRSQILAPSAENPSQEFITHDDFSGFLEGTLMSSSCRSETSTPTDFDRKSDRTTSAPWNTIDSFLNIAIRAEFNAFSLRSSNSTNCQDLNDAEKAKIVELTVANKAMLAPVDEDGPIKQETSGPSLINVINLTDIAIRRLIKMSKRVGGFKNLCQEDQIALLKGGCTELMILRSVMTYDPDQNSWRIPHSTAFNHIKVDVLKKARGNVYEEHQRFIQSFDPRWRTDENIMLVLSAITLFTPERPNVVHKDVIRLEQDSYYYLLKRYLESVYSGCEARSVYLKLIQKIEELHILNENHVRIFLEVNPKEVEPLLLEIFDLKQSYNAS